jgi:selenocysteine lyase/cysteine desulfurase
MALQFTEGTEAMIDCTINRRHFIKASAPAVAAMLDTPIYGAASFDWNRVRADFDFNPDFPQLSTVVTGLVPRPVRNEMIRLMDQANDLRKAPGSRELPEARSALRERVLQRAAKLVGASAETVALTRNTTEGIATVLGNLPLNAGDEIIASQHEHAPYYGLLDRRMRRDGARLKLVSVPSPANNSDDVVAAYANAITKKTKVMLVTHVAITGQILPVAKICKLAREAGVQTLVDGALALGHVPIDVTTMQCDYYAGNFHKWACGPHGTGIFYVRPDRLQDLDCLFGAAEFGTDGRADARVTDRLMSKFTSVGRHPQYHFDALDKLFDWLDDIGTSRREARLKELSQGWLAKASAIKGFRTASAPELTASLAAWEIAGRSTLAVSDVMWERHRLVLGTTDALAGLFDHANAAHLILTNTALFTNNDDLDRLLNGIEDAARRA